MMSSASSTANGSSPTCCTRDRHRVAETERIALADVVDVGEVVTLLHFLEQVVLARLLERQQGQWNRCTVQLYEIAITPRAEIVNRAGNQLLCPFRFHLRSRR